MFTVPEILLGCFTHGKRFLTYVSDTLNSLSWISILYCPKGNLPFCFASCSIATPPMHGSQSIKSRNHCRSKQAHLMWGRARMGQTPARICVSQFPQES